MSELPPINLYRDKSMPTVYRRSDISRQVAMTGKQTSSVLSVGRSVDAGINGCNRPLQNCTAQIQGGFAGRKGMIIDIWT